MAPTHDRDPYVKHNPSAPDGFFAAEAAGLAWLAEPDAVPVVKVLSADDTSLTLEHLEEAGADAAAAREFGAGLARLHDAGADGFGWAPAEDAWFGPLDAPFTVPTTSHADFPTFWVTDRLEPVAERTARLLGGEGEAAVRAAIEVIAAGPFDGIAGEGIERPARVHGDLWSGNLLWTAAGGTLIDPAAHGGHRLEDLALLSLFGAPHLEDIYAGYEEAHPLPASWREDLPAHLFFALLAHVDLFGSAYTTPTVRTARQIIERAEALGTMPA
ncbi:MAG: fructosamine kinase family protein [Brachybacterium sp.]|nr:fructosamine kinase family protein [Brachybacterium sp.]